jgi:hypothetical protein
MSKRTTYKVSIEVKTREEAERLREILRQNALPTNAVEVIITEIEHCDELEAAKHKDNFDY